MLTFDDLDTWLAGLAALDDVRSAVLDPAALVTPGVWCRVPSFGLDTLADDQYRLDLELHLAVSDQADWKRARRDLAKLFEAVHEHIGKPRINQVAFETLALPDGTAVPALRFPYSLTIVPDVD